MDGLRHHVNRQPLNKARRRSAADQRARNRDQHGSVIVVCHQLFDSFANIAASRDKPLHADHVQQLVYPLRQFVDLAEMPRIPDVIRHRHQRAWAQRPIGWPWAGKEPLQVDMGRAFIKDFINPVCHPIDAVIVLVPHLMDAGTAFCLRLVVTVCRGFRGARPKIFAFEPLLEFTPAQPRDAINPRHIRPLAGRRVDEILAVEVFDANLLAVFAVI